MMVAVVPIRTLSSFRALLSMGLNWMFSLRRLSPEAASSEPCRFNSARTAATFFSTAGSGFDTLASSANNSNTRYTTVPNPIHISVTIERQGSVTGVIGGCGSSPGNGSGSGGGWGG